MSTSVPMDECQSSHIENHYDEAYNHQMRQNKICITLPFALNLLLLMDTFGHHNFADLALWFQTYSYITKETVIKNVELK